MEQITNYVKPELIVVAIALYFVGMALKQAQAVKDKYIPLILGGISIAICAIYVFATCACPCVSQLCRMGVRCTALAGISKKILCICTSSSQLFYGFC